jgi:cytidylate kinase
MKNQIIVSISREYGSGGHEIAEMVSKKMGLKLYDKNILKEIAEKNNIALTELKEFDEKPKNVFLSRSVKGYSNSLEENMAHMEFEYIREKAEEGESFVIVGRCSEEVLKDYEGLVSVFVKGDMEVKTARIMERLDMNEEDAVDEIKKQDKNRRRYHNQYSEHKWGDSRYYDMCINSSRLGLEKTARLIEKYISGEI